MPIGEHRSYGNTSNKTAISDLEVHSFDIGAML